MSWWISRHGHAEGPFDDGDMRKRIALNLIGSLDRVSSDGKKWKYLKDTELWRSPQKRPMPQMPQQQVPSPFAVQTPESQSPQPSSLLKPVSAARDADGYKSSVPIPERSRLEPDDVPPRKTSKTLLWCIGGGTAALTLVAATGMIVVVAMSPRDRGTEKIAAASSAVPVVATNKPPEKAAPLDVFSVVKANVALIECKEGSGTGFLLGMDGKTYLVSNEHVVRSGGEIKARLIDGTLLRLGEFSVAADGRDLARFEVLNCTNAPLRLRASMPNMNEEVTVYGNSLGGGVATESKGFVQGVGPVNIETNAEIVHGNSGSPLVDKNGEVVGVAASIEQTDSGKADWGNLNTRYDGKVRRFAVRFVGVKWKTLSRREYEAQIRALTDFETFWDYLLPFLLLDSRKVEESKLVYTDLAGKDFTVPHTGFDEMLKAVADAYGKRCKREDRFSERIKGRKDFVRRLTTEVNANELSEDAAKKVLGEYDDKTKNSFEKMKEAYRKMILVRKEAVNHAQTFLGDRLWDAPQVVDGYKDGIERRSVTWYRGGCKYFLDLMNQKMKDLDKSIKEIEQGDDDDDED